MGTDVVDAMSLELGSLKLNEDCFENSRSSRIVLNAVPQEFVANMERSLAQGDDAASASSSGKGDKDDSVMDLKCAAKQGDASTALSQKDTALFAKLMRVIQRGGDWKELKADHLKAYLCHHGLRISGPKKVLQIRVEQHLKIKDGQGQDIHPRLSFIINFQVVDPWECDELLIEVLWSTSTKPCNFMEQLRIKGRNLYRTDIWRQPWINKEDRLPVLAKKRESSKVARFDRIKQIKSNSKGLSWSSRMNVV